MGNRPSRATEMVRDRQLWYAGVPCNPGTLDGPGCPSARTRRGSTLEASIVGCTRDDIDHRANRLYVACDGGALVALETIGGEVRGEWPLSGAPDATFFN